MPAETSAYPLSPDDELEQTRTARINGDFSREVLGEDRGSPLAPADTTDPFDPLDDTDVDPGERYFDENTGLGGDG